MEKVDGAVSSYIDDIIVNETEVTVEEVEAHQRKFGWLNFRDPWMVGRP